MESKFKNPRISIQLVVVCFLLATKIGFAQAPQERPVRIIVAPNHLDWTYQVGEKVTFSITVMKNGNPLPNVQINYIVGPEKMGVTKSENLTLANGKVEIDGGTLKTPGFLRCIVTTVVDG